MLKLARVTFEVNWWVHFKRIANWWVQPVVVSEQGQEVLKMLVITRREGEEVVIGDPRNPLGVVRIAGVKGDRVRVAFEFPREVQVHRREVADQILESGPSPVVATIGKAAGAEGSST